MMILDWIAYAVFSSFILMLGVKFYRNCRATEQRERDQQLRIEVRRHKEGT